MSQASTPQPAGAKEIGLAVRARRRELRLTQKTLAALAGVTQQTVSAIEKGRRRPAPPILKMLARALDSTTDQLLGSVGGVAETGVAFVSEREEWLRLYDELTAAQRAEAVPFARSPAGAG